MCRTWPKCGEAAAKCSSDTNKWTLFEAMTMENAKGNGKAGAEAQSGELQAGGSSILSVKPQDLKVHAQRWYYLDTCLSPPFPVQFMVAKRRSKRSIIKTGHRKPLVSIHHLGSFCIHRPSRVLRKEPRGCRIKGEGIREQRKGARKEKLFHCAKWLFMMLLLAGSYQLPRLRL